MFSSQYVFVSLSNDNGSYVPAGEWKKNLSIMPMIHEVRRNYVVYYKGTEGVIIAY